MTPTQKEVMGVSKETIQMEKIEEVHTSDQYKEYESMSEKEKEKIEAIPRKEEVPYSKIEEIKDDFNYEESKNSIPRKFNLSDIINIKVENQGSFELCWDFASIKSLETNVALKTGTNLDLSEIHLDYSVSNDFYGIMRSIHSGGNFTYFKEYSSHSGATLQQANEYHDYDRSEYNTLFNREEVVTATETVDFPSVSLINKEDVEYNQKLKEFRNVIKTHLMTNGSIYAAIDSDCIIYGDQFDTNCYSEKGFADHAISIVGWDDDYSKENFKTKDGKMPENDGAYIALNSWGTEFGNNGYFYISYEDSNVENQMSGVISSSLNKEGLIKIGDIQNEKIRNSIYSKLNKSIQTIDGEHYVSKVSLDSVVELDLSNSNIKNEDLKYIKLFSKLTTLNLSNNNITDISELANNEIYSIDLSNNPGIQGYGNLKYAYSINLSNDEVNDLENIKSDYIMLDLSGNKNINFSTIPEKTSELKLSNCDIGDTTQLINSLKNLKYLSSIDLSNNNITDYKEIVDYINNAEIDQLILSHSKIEDITIFNDIDVYSLNLSYNEIKNLSNFSYSNKLMQLDLSGNRNLTGFNKIENIDTLILKDCNIETIDFSKDANVGILDLSDNKITNADFVENLSNLYMLSLSNNDISKIKSNYISILNVEDCGLEQIDILDIPNVHILNLSSNKKLNNVVDIVKNVPDKSQIFLRNIQVTREEANEIDKIVKENKLMLVGTKINIKENSNNIVAINDGWLSESLIRNNRFIEVSNGLINSKNNEIIILDNTKNSVKVNSDFMIYGNEGRYYPSIIFELN